MGHQEDNPLDGKLSSCCSCHCSEGCLTPWGRQVWKPLLGQLTQAGVGAGWGREMGGAGWEAPVARTQPGGRAGEAKRTCGLGPLEPPVGAACGAQPPKDSKWLLLTCVAVAAMHGPLRTILSSPAPVSETHTPRGRCPGSSRPELPPRHCL